MRAVLIAVMAGGLGGCAVLKASPAEDTGFLPHAELLKPQPERSPFNAIWYADKDKLFREKKNYQWIHIAPIVTEFFEAKLREDKKMPPKMKEERLEDLREIAKYAHARFEEEIGNYPNMPMKVSQDVKPHTFVMEMQIIELNPTNPIGNAIGTAAGIFVTGGGLIKAAATGSIAMEALLRDGDTGEILVEVKDREKDKTSPFSIRDFERYAHARNTINEWAKIFAELMATPYEHKVDGLDPITLDPT